MRLGGFSSALIASALLGFGLAAPADAQGLFRRGKTPAVEMEKINVDPLLPEIDRALSEGRLMDAGRLLDSTYAAGATDLRLVVRSGELHLARRRFEEAVRSFMTAESDARLKGVALQGRGIALSQLNRSDEAIVVLIDAVTTDPSLWRAWNALGVEKDRRKDWAGAEEAYTRALTSPQAKALVLNNRGYSRLLQGKYEEASADFVEALQKEPGLAPARTNLRLSLALRGDYQKATTVNGTEERGTVLNNAGFAAVMRGDLKTAEVLFQQAIEARGASHGRAMENLAMVQALRTSEVQTGAPQ